MICSAFAFDPATCARAAGLLWVVVVFAGFLGFSWRKERRGKIAPLKLQETLGMKGLPIGVFSLVAVAWGALTVVLFIGVFAMIAETIFWRDGSGSALAFRWHLARLAALTTVFGAVVAVPITLNRLRLTREANDTAAESLFNEKFAQASSDLYAQRQVTKRADSAKRHYTVWQDDIPRRNAAIDRLEGLVKERPVEAERVSRLLSVYVRELSREYPPQPVPETEDIQEIKEWAHGLEPVRTDMQSAVQVLGRLTKIDGVDVKTVEVDLRKCNLQGFDLRRLEFPIGSKFQVSHMQGAYMRATKMTGARLRRAHLQGIVLANSEIDDSDLRSTRLQGADLRRASMKRVNLSEGANLEKARLKGAFLNHASMSGSILDGAILPDANFVGVDLGGARLCGADLRNAQFMGASLVGARLHGAALNGAGLQGADISFVQFDEKTQLTGTQFRGAACEADKVGATIERLRPFWRDIFSDGYSGYEDSNRPAHWPTEKLNSKDFETQWRAWQRSIGMNPDGSMRTP